MGVVLLSYLIAEIVVMVAVAKLVGALTMLLLMGAISLAGALCLRRQFVRLVVRSAGGSSLADGAARTFACLLIAVPGFVSSAVGVALLLPPVRRMARPFVFARVTRWSGFTKRFGTEIVDVTLVDDDRVSKPSQSTRRELG